MCGIETYAFDKKNGYNLWADTIAKEMQNVKLAFQIMSNSEKAPIEYQFVKCIWSLILRLEKKGKKLH